MGPSIGLASLRNPLGDFKDQPRLGTTEPRGRAVFFPQLPPRLSAGLDTDLLLVSIYGVERVDGLLKDISEKPFSTSFSGGSSVCSPLCHSQRFDAVLHFFFFLKDCLL